MRTGAGLVRKVDERVLAEETAWQRACKGEWVRPPGDAQLSERALGRGRARRRTWMIDETMVHLPERSSGESDACEGEKRRRLGQGLSLCLAGPVLKESAHLGLSRSSVWFSEE